jgi:anti-sigma factor RsiW
MIDRDSPVTAMTAYLCRRHASADRIGAIEAWLAAHPDDAAHVAEWRAMAEIVRDRYGSVAEQPVPGRFDLAKLARGRTPWRKVAAAAALAAATGVIAGWVAHAASSPAPSAVEIMTNEALSAHKLYIAEVRHPIEVRAAEKHLIPWLSKRVGTNLRIPDLKEYSLQLLGGRLLPGPIGPAALFVCESGGERFTIYCSRSKKVRTALRYQPPRTWPPCIGSLRSAMSSAARPAATGSPKSRRPPTNE